MIRGFLKIASSKGWIQCSIDIRFKFLTAEWYIVTFWLLCIRKSRLPRSKVDLDRDISMMFSRYPLALKLCLNFKRYSSDTSFGEHICSKQSDCLAFNETMFYAWWVACGEVRKLEGLGRLVMGFDVHVGFFANLSFKHCGIEEDDFVHHSCAFVFILRQSRKVYCLTWCQDRFLQRASFS